MIEPCNFLAPNGEKSDLAQSLIEEYGPERAISVWDVVHSDDVANNILDWKKDTRFNNEKGELIPAVAKYVHNVYTARNEWAKIRSDAQLGEMKMRKEYYQPSAERLASVYEGANVIASKDTYGRTLYKVTIPLPKFNEETASNLLSGNGVVGEYADNLTAPSTYIVPELPEKEIKPNLGRPQLYALGKGVDNTFTTGSNDGMAQGDKAMIYINGRPMIATYEGQTEDGKAHRYSVANPYNPKEIASQEMGLSKDTVTPSLASDSSQLHQSLGRMFAQVRDENGQPVEGKYFTPEQQNSAVDAVMTDMYGYLRNSLRNGDTLTASMLLAGLRQTQAKLRAFNNGLIDVAGGVAPDSFMWSDLDPMDAQNRSTEITNVLRSYDQIAGFVMERLRAYGFNISDNIRQNITDYLNKSVQLSEEENQMEAPMNSGEEQIGGAEVGGLKDWSDSPFELDPRDTASKRMKFFLATIKDAEFGTEEAPKHIQMIFSDPDIIDKVVKGTKVYTVRTPDQVKRIKLGADGRGSIVLDGKTIAVEAHKTLQNDSDFAAWKDVFDEEGLTPEPGSMVYKLSQFKPKENVLVNKKSAMGFPRLAPFDQTFTGLLSKVQDAQEVSYDGFIRAIADSGSPTMLKVVQELQNSDQQLKNEFYKVFSKQYYRMRIMLFNNRQDGGEDVTQGTFINANRFNEIDTLINGWRQKQMISPIITEDNGKSGVDQALAQKHFEQFQKLTTFDWSKATPQVLDKLQNWTQEFLNDIGIPMKDASIRDFRANAEKLTKGTQFAGSWLRQYQVTKDGKPNGVISALVMRLAGLAQPDEAMDVEIDPVEDFLRNNNPLYTENTALRILAKSEAKFTPQLFTDMHKNSENKNIYAYGLHTYESHTFASLKGDEDFRAQYASIPFAAKSWLLGRLKTAEQREKIELNYLDGIKAAYRRGGGTTRPDMSPREQELTSVLAFLNRGNKYGNFFDLTKSDKTTTPVFVNVEKFPVKSFSLGQDHARALNDVFESEFARVKHWEDNRDTVNNANYKAGGGLFYMLPQFNFEEMSKDVTAGRISKDDMATIWNEDGTIARHEDTIGRNEVVSHYMDQFVKKMARETRERWRGMGLFDDERSWLDQSYLKKARASLFIMPATDEQTKKPITDAAGNPLYLQFKNGQVTPITKADMINLTASLAALDYSTHYFLHNTSISQLISGDPALAYKGKAGDTQIKQVGDTMKEYEKRLAKDIAPGSDPSWDRNATYRSLTIKDPNYSSYLAEVIPGYRDLDSAADAQEITTTQEHLDTMFAQGLIPDKTYHEMTDIIKAGKGGYYEFTNPEHLDIVLQAQKPVQVGSDFNNGVMEIHYIKTSAYPLLPQLTRGLEIDNLRQHMEQNNIQRAVFKSGKKLGSPTKTANVFDGDGKYIGFHDDIDTSTQTLTRAGFRIQQEVPYDETKDHILTVSQMNKLVVEGIQDLKNFSMPDYSVEAGEAPRTVDLDGESIKALKEDTRRQMFDIKRKQLLKNIGAEETEDGYQFTNHEKMFKALEQEAIARNYPPNDLDAIRTRLSSGTLVLPLFLNGSAFRFEALMMSMAGKTTAIQMAGKSFIQASSLGYKGHENFENLTDEQKKGIVYIESHDPSQNLRSMDKDEKGQSKAAQVLVPFNFLSKDGKTLDVSKFTKTTEDGRTVIDSEKLPDSLRRFIGARIPNQGHSSMLPIEIVGFIPKQMGDLMVVPAEITKQMGSDFDVDKLYCYRPGYGHDVTSGRLYPQRMTSKVDEATGESRPMNMAQLQQRYFDIHWSILTHEAMFDRVNAPLDRPELQNEKALAEARNAGGYKNYFEVNNQMDSFLSQKDAKVLVGATAVNNTFNALIQDKDLRLGQIVATEDSVKEIPRTIDFLDEVTGKVLNLTKLSGYGEARYFAHENPTDKDTPVWRTKGDNISTQLSEVVDHSKNRTIDALNLNQYTFPASAAMSMLETRDGQALSLKYNARLVQQEAVKDYVARMAAGNDSLSTNYTSDIKEKVFMDLLSEYAAKAGADFDPDKKILFSPQLLNQMLDTPEAKKDESYYAQQYHAFDTFRKLVEIGDVMRAIQSKFNQDTRGAGSTLLDSLNTQADLQNVYNNGKVLGVEDIGGPLGPDGSIRPTTEAGYAFKNTVDVANGIFPELLPYHKIQPLYGSISTEMGRDKLTVDHQRRIADAVRSNLFSDANNGLFENASAERARLLFDTDAGPSLARRLTEAQSTYGAGNYFITRLATHLGTTDAQESTITYNATGASSLDDFEVVKAWAGLLTSDDPQQRALGEDLLRYTYATGGMQTAQNFAKFAPIGYLAGLPIARELNLKVATLERSVSGVAGGALEQQVFQHNPDMAKQIKPDFSQIQEYHGTPLDKVPEKFTLYKDVTNSDYPAASLRIVATDAEGKPTLRYPDYLSSRTPNGWLLYKRTNELDSATEYQRIDTLGKGDILEYDSGRNYARSIFPENRALKPLYYNADAEFAPTPAAPVLAITHQEEVKQNFGLTPEGIPLSEAIENMLTHPNVADAHQELLMNLTEIAMESSKIVAGMANPIVRTSQEGEVGNRGSFKYHMTYNSDNEGDGQSVRDYRKPTIVLYDGGMKTPDEGVATMIHELAHYNSSLVLNAYEAFEAGKVSKSAWMTPEMDAAVAGLEKLRQQAVAKLDVTNPEFAYALSSNKELVSAIFANRDFQRALNQTPSDQPERSLLGKVVDGIKDLLNNIAQFMGIRVKEGNMLHEGINYSAIIMGLDVRDLNNMDAVIPTEPSTTIPPEVDSSKPGYISEEHSDQSIGFDNLDEGHSEEIAKSIGNLQSLLKNISAKHILPTEHMGEDAAREYQLRGQEIARLQYEIGKLQASGTLHSLLGIGSRQMKTIDTMMAGDKQLSRDQIDNLMDTADTWEHTIDELYADVTNGEVPKEAQALRGQAAERKAKLVNLVKTYEIEDPTSVINSLADFNASNMTVGAFTGYTADLSRTNSMVAQQTDKYLKTASRLHTEEMRRTRAELNEYQARVNKYAKAKGLKPQDVFDSVMQAGSQWGLVKMFSPEYYNFKARTGAQLKAKLIVSDTIEDPATRLNAVRQAYAEYRDTINKNVVYVDTSRLFDDKDGTHLDTPAAQKHRAELEKELGPDLAKTMIDSAHEQFENYLRDRYSYKSARQEQNSAQLADYEEELDARKDMTEAEKDAAYDQYKQGLATLFYEDYNAWEGNNSPNVFFRSMRGEYKGFNPGFNNFGAIVDAPRRNSGNEEGSFYDPRFIKVQNDPELRDIYNFIHSKMDQFKNMLPAHITSEMYDNFLPIVEAEKKLGFSAAKIKGVVKEVLTEAISMEGGMAEYSRMDTGMIPIKYTNPRSVELENRDRDVFRLLEKFGNMAIHYKRATEVQSSVELLHRIMVDQISATQGGQFDRINSSTKHLSDMVAYAKDRLLYQKSRLAEGEVGKLYSLNPIKQYKTERQIVDLKKQLTELDDQYAEGMDPEEYRLKKGVLTAKIAAIPHTELMLSRMGDTMIKLTELKTLSYNPFSAFANLSFGLVSLLTYANGQVDFNKATAFDAFTTMLNATKRAVTFGAVKSDTADKILALMEKYNTMGDLLDSDYAGASRIQNKKSLAAKLASPYQLLRNSDYFMKGSMLVAMMKTEKITVDGKETSLWDAYDNKGNFKGEDKRWSSERPEEETEFLKFQARAIQVSKVIMGNQDHASPMMIKKTSLGRLIAQFRATWLPEGINSRFGEERFDSQLGRTVKGRYNTYKDLGAIGSVMTLARQAMSTILSIDPFTGKKRNGEALSPVDIENMRRNFAEAATYMTVFASVIALKMMLHKDDDDGSPDSARNKAFGQTLINLVVRNRQDMELYSSPDLFTSINQSLIPSLKVWIDFQRAVRGTVKYIGQDQNSKVQVKGSAVAEKWMRALPYTAIYPKFHTMWSKDMDNLNN